MRGQLREVRLGARGRIQQTRFKVQEKRDRSLHVCLAFCYYRLEHLVLGIEGDQGMPQY